MKHPHSAIAMPARQSGFTLIELMIGVVLGMLTVLVITQVTVQAESRKRTVSMGSDAQINGSLSLFALQRDLQMAGYGAAAAPGALGCTVTGQYDASGEPFSFTLAPVVISDGVDGAPDSITVLQARKQSFSVPIPITENHTQTGNYFVVDSSLGVAVNDVMIAVPKAQSGTTQCALFNVAADTSASNTTLSASRIPHVTGSSDYAKWNQSNVFPTAGYESGSYLLNLGNMAQQTYSVDANQNLTLTARSAANGLQASFELYPQIVNLQALYGKDTGTDGVVDVYNTTAPTNSAEWGKVLTIRLVVVARSNQYEKEEVTPSAPQWDVGASVTVEGETLTDCHGSSQCIALKVDGLTDWKHYRYKVYETIVPLRNVLWNS